MWLKFNNNLLGTEVMCGAVYVEPEGSAYLKENVYEELENEISKYIDMPVLLLGDFNARTGKLSDIMLTDKYNVYDEECPDLENLLNLNSFNVNRNMKDVKNNNHGHLLVSLCKDLNMVVLNGRVGTDAISGEFTCKGCSTVDYCIASDTLLSRVLDFSVLPFNECFSDVHCPVTTKLKLPAKTRVKTPQTDQISPVNNVNNSRHCPEKPVNPKPKWKDGFDAIFKESLNLQVERIDEICNVVDELYNDNNVTESDVNNVYSEIKDILFHSAKECGSIINYTVTNKKRSERKKYNPWWNAECEIARKNFNKARKKPVNNDLRKSMSKEYKKVINRAIRNYETELHSKLRNLKSKNTKEYWNIINNAGQSKQNDQDCTIKCSDFLNHFENMNANAKTEPFNIDEYSSVDDSILNIPITIDEVCKNIMKLKNGKACGQDTVINEFIKYSNDNMKRLYTKFFNLVLFKGCVPNEWTVGVVKPIYKNKGDINDVDSYRGITLLSCLGKLFTFTLNERLKKFVNNNKKIFEEQTGFRNGYSTLDHIFTLEFICNYYVNRGKRLYVAFIDYKKAFDCVDRVLLWKKVIAMDIKGPVLNVIYKLYSNAKSCIKHGGKLSEFFVSNVGVRQGECLSPLLFAIFLNDLVSLINESHKGLTDLGADITNRLPAFDIDNYCKLGMLLYADDTILMAESPDDLQSALNTMSNFCKLNKLEINVTKTNIMVFSKGKIRKLPIIYYNNTKLEVKHSFCYLGLNLNYNCKLKLAQKELLSKATKAMFGLISKSRKLNLPLDLQISLFDSVVKPVMLYGCEIWGPQDCNIANKLQLRFLKLIMGLKKRTPTVMVRGETGCCPISVDINCRVLNYWFKLANCDNNNRIAKIMYDHMLALYNLGDYVYPWLEFVKTTLSKLDMTFVFNAQTEGISFSWFKRTVKQRLIECYIQEWSHSVQNNPICEIYKTYKSIFEFEKYLVTLPKALANSMLQFRTRNISVLCESFYNIIEFNSRSCPLCHTNKPDEIHLLLHCRSLNSHRLLILSPDCKFLATRFLVRYFNNAENHFKIANYLRYISRMLKES